MSDRQCLHLRNIGEIMNFHILIIFWGHSMKQLKKNEEANAMIQEAVWN